MKKIAEFSVRFPVTMMMIALAVILLGVISFSRLGTDLFPELNNPRIYIELEAGEKPPEEIENSYVEGLESLAASQKGVTGVSSVSKVGSARITVEYSWETDMDEAFLDLQKTVTNYTQNSDIEQLSLSQYDPNSDPVMLIAFSHDNITDMNDLRMTAENYLRNELVRLEGIADVGISGYEENEVIISTDPERLEAFGLTQDVIASRISALNSGVSGGTITEMGKQYVIKGVSVLQSIDDFKNTIVAYRQKTIADGKVSDHVPVFLSDVADISMENKDPVNITRINGERCIGLSIYKETRYNTVKAVEELKDEMEIIKKALPGYNFVVVDNQSDFISSAIGEVQETAIIGIILAVIILFVFLRRLGTTLIICVAIPVSVVATFNLMYFNGLTLNIMTLGGLALGAGMLVDNAIVVVENIIRNIESGMDIRQAAITGTSQVGGAITAATVTTIVVFLPIVYIHGSSGELFRDQAWTVAFSLISSLFAALLLIPVLSSRFLKKRKSSGKSEAVSFPWYESFLKIVIKKRGTVLLITALIMILTYIMLGFIGSDFLPKSRADSFKLSYSLEAGTDLNTTEKFTEGLESIIRQSAGDSVLIYSHTGPSTTISGDENSPFEDENSGWIKVNTGYLAKADALLEFLRNYLSGYEGVEFQFSGSESALNNMIGSSESPVEVEIRGKDLEVLQDLSGKVFDIMLKNDNLTNVENSFQSTSPEVEVVLDNIRAGMYNISVSDLSAQLKNQLSGKEAGEWDHEGELKDIAIRLPEMSLNEFRKIKINVGGRLVRLDQVAGINVINSPGEIYRDDQTRNGIITADISGGLPLDKVISRLRAEVERLDIPQDYKIRFTGEEEKRAESMADLSFALILSIILVYMVLASQFESLLHPFTIMLSLPLAAAGTVFLFFILGRSFDIMAYIGIIMLAGIAVNDSIVLVDAINQLRKEGAKLDDAVIEAGSKRIRPIIMTSITTILALLPLTIGFGEGAVLRSPMALAVIGGLVTSTILTLIVIPALYYIFENWKSRLSANRM